MKPIRQKQLTRGLPLLLAGFLAGCCSVEDKAGLHGNADVLFTLGGVSESPVEIRHAVLDTAAHRVVVPLEDGVDMECILRAEQPSQTKALSPFPSGNTFYIFSDNGSSVTPYGPYTSGGGDIRLTGLTAGTYTFSAYSLNDPSTLPVLPSGASTIENISPANDLLHWVQTGTTAIPAASGTNYTIAFKHKLPQVQVTVHAKDKTNNAPLPISTITASLSPNNYATMDVRNGTLSAGSSGGYPSPLSWNTTLPATDITSAYQGVYIPSSSATSLVFTMSSVTVDGTAYSNKSVTFPAATLVPGTRYSLTVTIRRDANNPDNLQLGTGVFSGKTCFDIAQGNDGTNSCAPLSARSSQQTDFSDRNPQDPAGANATARPYTGVQVYTFTPSGTVSNVRFVYTDASGQVIESMSAQDNYLVHNISSPCKVTVAYKSTLNTDLQGLTVTNALQATLYVVYNNAADGSGMDVKLPLSITLMDCACCGAYIAQNTWKSFMCYNLGADDSLDPFTPAAGLHGAKYRWGAKNASYSMYDDQLNSGTISGWTSSSTAAFPFQTTTDTTGWMSGNNPCPAGWRVPTLTEWQGVFNTTLNTQTRVGVFTNNANDYTNYTAGLQFGGALFLPAASTRIYYTGQMYYLGCLATYWSSSAPDPGFAAYVYFNKFGIGSGEFGTRGDANPVRCIEE